MKRLSRCVSDDFTAFRKRSSDLAAEGKVAAHSFEKKLHCLGNSEKIFKHWGVRLKSRNTMEVILDEGGNEAMFCLIFVFAQVAFCE